MISTSSGPSTPAVAARAKSGLIARVHRQCYLVMATLFSIIVGVQSTDASPFTFQPLGDLPGRNFMSQAWAISADGSTVVGASDSASGQEAFLWNSSSGMLGLGDIPDGTFGSRAYAVSSDGSVVAGFGRSSASTQASRWTSAGGMAGIGELPGGVALGYSHGVSADGSVVVGMSAIGTLGFGNSFGAFRWTSAGGMIPLGDLPGGNTDSGAYAISPDASVIVGYGTSPAGKEAARWTSGGVIGLGDLPGGDFNSLAQAVSGDGSVVVGIGTSANGPEAFRWTADGGMVGLGFLAPLEGTTVESMANGVSADGSVVVGRSYVDPTATDRHAAFIWTEIHGMQNLQQLLVAAGVSGLDDWNLHSVTGISADGRTLVGYGTNPLGRTEAWIATVPEPSTAMLALTAFASLWAIHSRRKRPTSG